MRAFYFSGDDGEIITEKDIPADLADQAKEYRAELIGKIADFDESIGEKFLMEEEPSEDELRAAIRRTTIARQVVPMFCGSAYKNKAVQKLLDGVRDYLPNPTEKENSGLAKETNEPVKVLCDPAKPLVMYAFKLDEGRYGQLTYMRIYQGTVKKGDFIYNARDGKKIKVPRLVKMHSDEMADIEEASAGDIVAMFGVDCYSGDTFTDGTVELSMTSMHVPDEIGRASCRERVSSPV